MKINYHRRSIPLFFKAFWPIIADFVGQEFAIISEWKSVKGAGNFFGGFLLSTYSSCPKNPHMLRCHCSKSWDHSVAGKGGESVVQRVERDAINCIDICFGGLLTYLSVALKAEVVLLAQLCLTTVIVLDSAATLDRADYIPFSITKDSDWRRNKLKKGLCHFLRVPGVWLEILR